VTSCYLNKLGILCSIGNSAEEVVAHLRSGRSGLTVTESYSKGNPLPLGLCDYSLPEIPLPELKWKSRNNQFALAALQQMKEDVDAAIQRYGVNRIGVVIGTSTSGLAESEAAVRQWVKEETVSDSYDYAMHEMGAAAQFIARLLGTTGPCYGISTACSSGAKAIATAKRLVQAGLCDAVIAGGVDTLCQLTVLGFSSLEAVSNEICNPFSRNRKGINIGEGAALFLVSAEPVGVELCGAGEGSDAHHISAPDPTGSGANRCMTAALVDAGVSADEVGYVNLHGTATELNDQMESIAMNQVFGPTTPCSSTKPYTGHTLGAAGAIEAGICWLLLETNNAFLPAHLWDGEADPYLPEINLIAKQLDEEVSLNYALSNSFAFGGNNISLLLGKLL